MVKTRVSGNAVSLIRIFLCACVCAFLGSVTAVQAATAIWTGTGADNKWSTPANWEGETAPSAEDDLVFPSGANQSANENDFPVGTSFHSITISGSDFFTIVSSVSTAPVSGRFAGYSPVSGRHIISKRIGDVTCDYEVLYSPTDVRVHNTGQCADEPPPP